MSTPTTGLKPRACDVCGEKERLLRCSACQSVWYCGRDHQVSHRPDHKQGCSAVRRARAAYEREDQALRNLPDEGEWGFGPNAFEKGAGRFWSIEETRDYMRARYHLVDTVLHFFGGTDGYNEVDGRVDAVSAALEHLLDMVRLSRGDGMGVRSIIPGLYLALGRDQEAYDFVKWYATTGSESDYDWGNMDLPFLDAKDADALEAPLEAWTNGQFLKLSYVASVMLIKVRILLDLRSIESTRPALAGSAPNEIDDVVREKLLGSVVASRPEILKMNIGETRRLIDKVEGQIEALYESMDKSNPFFWRLMFDDPDAAASDRPSMFSPGSKEEANLAIGYCCTSWLATPGAIDVVRDVAQTM